MFVFILILFLKGYIHIRYYSNMIIVIIVIIIIIIIIIIYYYYFFCEVKEVYTSIVLKREGKKKR